MGFGDKKHKQEKILENDDGRTIDINAEMQGTLAFKDPVNLRINGEFSGKLDVRGTLSIGSSATVKADINGDNIIVAGKVMGNIVVHKMLTLMPTAVLVGDITTPKLNIVEGAIFEGRCHMNGQKVSSSDVTTDLTWSLEEVASYLELEQKTIVQLANDGKIPAVKKNNQWSFDRKKIDEWASAEKV